MRLPAGEGSRIAAGGCAALSAAGCTITRSGTNTSTPSAWLRHATRACEVWLRRFMYPAIGHAGYLQVAVPTATGIQMLCGQSRMHRYRYLSKNGVTAAGCAAGTALDQQDVLYIPIRRTACPSANLHFPFQCHDRLRILDCVRGWGKPILNTGFVYRPLIPTVRT